MSAVLVVPRTFLLDRVNAANMKAT